ncbi:MAG: serine protease [Clostridiaceae bacterium]|nr:serine protease [Clostridiaceae bacterium]
MRSVNRTTACVMLVCIMLAATAYASETPFSSDVESINEAARSVLMLEVYDANDELIATGSGFVAFDDRTLVTNNHVIEDAEIVIGISDSGNQYIINKVLVADEKSDVAILKFISSTDLLPLGLNSRDEVQRAEQVVAIGSPLGFKNSVSLGNISAMFEGEGISFIQFTAPISHGSSGGALFNDKGRVIGITSGYFLEGQNINLAINIDEVIKLYDMSRFGDPMKLSKHTMLNSAAQATSMPSPTKEPTPKPAAEYNVRPTATPAPLDMLVNSLQVNKFDGAVFKKYRGYEYDKFDKIWIYGVKFKLWGSLTFHLAVAGGKNMLPPFVGVSSDDRIANGKMFIASIDIVAGDEVFTFSKPTYLQGIDGLENGSFFYLGSVGKHMIESMTSAKSLDIRLNGSRNIPWSYADYLKWNDEPPDTFELKSQNISSLAAWIKNINKHKVFDCFTSIQLSYADKAHEAYVH